MSENIGTVTETKAFEQLGVFVLDGSGSMRDKGETGQAKAEEVNTAVRGVIARMKISRNRDNFQLAVITYDNKATTRVAPTPVKDMNEVGDYNPLQGHGGMTAIGNALEAAAIVANDFLSQQKAEPRSVVIVIMSDGQNTSGGDPILVAEKIKNSGQRITLCAAAYGRDTEIDALTLQKIASTAAGYVRAYDPEALRKFFEASVSRIATA